MFPQYLLASAAAGGVIGAVHGAVRGFIELHHDTGSIKPPTTHHTTEYILRGAGTDGLQGLLMGPWAPVLAPLWLTVWKRHTRCPHVRTVM